MLQARLLHSPRLASDGDQLKMAKTETSTYLSIARTARQ
jgi:hypothetical protein